MSSEYMTSSQYADFFKVTDGKLTNGHILAISDHSHKNNLGNSHVLAVISEISRTPLTEINAKAVHTKVSRVLQNSSKKRGKYREQYLSEIFNVPTCTTQSSTITIEEQPTEKPEDVLEREQLHKSLETTKVQLEERRSKVRVLQEEKKQLKRKLSRKEDYKSMKIRVRSLEQQTKVQNRNIEKAERKNEQLCKKVKEFQHLYIQNNKKLSSVKKELKELEVIHNRDKSQEDEQHKLNLMEKIKELDQSNKYLQCLINDENDLILYDEEKKTYTPEFVECVMNLTSYKVATQQVGSVVTEVARLCGKTPNQLPSRTTVDRIVDRKMSICHKQIGDILQDKEDTTLYTDETRKYGKTFETYVVSDEDQNTYILGLREMFSKSAQSTLDTFKSILKDIDTHCNVGEIEGTSNSIGSVILGKVKNTMSDRASTEKSFNVMLQQYRKEILPLVINNWGDLSTDERELCASMNNFYCGLHLLVGMADVAETALKKFEETYLENKDIGSATKPELKRFHKNESGTLRLLRTASKAFAMGGDEKNGVFSHWRTYLKPKKITNRIVRFKHNRFNLIFQLGHSVFYHLYEIRDFLANVHGTTNTLLRAVYLDVKEPLFVAGCRCLGLISKFISAPLWRIIESTGHILDMNTHYQTLIDFLDDMSKDATGFINGDSELFKEFIDKDSVLEKLIQPDDDTDKICVPMLQNICLSFGELLKRMVADHLPEGKFWVPSDDLTRETRSAKKHNKLPEFVFGQLDHLMSYRPNATSLVNEAFIMYNHNKSREWLMGLSNEERYKAIEESRKEGRLFREQFKERLSEIEKKRLQLQKEKQKERERLDEQRLKRDEDLTNSVCFYGFWQSREEVNEGLGRLTSEREKINGLEAQLKFRKHVLGQKSKDKKIFNLTVKKASGKYVKQSFEVMKQNLLQLVKSAAEGPSEEVTHDNIPLLVGKKIEHQFSNKEFYTGKVICVVPGFPSWYNVQYDNDPAVYVYNLKEDYIKGDVRIIL